MSWEVRKIGEVCDVIPGFAFKSKDLGKAGIPVIKIGNITDDHRIDISSDQRFPESLTTDKHRKFTLSNKDILLAMTGATAGKVGRVRCPDGQTLLLNQRVAKLLPRGIDPDFFWSVVSTQRYRTIFYGLGGGAAQPNMSGVQIEDVEIPYPPPTVQSCIASILSAYDDLIENNRRRIQLLEHAARLLYKEWFIHLRFPGHEHVTITDGVPEGWKKSAIDDIAPFKYGKALKEENRIPGEYPVYGSSGMVGSHEKALVSGPGIIVGRKGNVGSVYWCASDFHPIDTVYFIEAQHCTMHLYYALLHTHFINTDVAVPGLNRDLAHSREILIPTPGIFRLFEEHVSAFRRQIRVLEASIKELSRARDLLLPRLMSREVLV